MDYSNLIDEARGSDEAAHRAAEQLVVAGVAALPAITEAVSNPWIDPGLLRVALRAIYAAAPLEALLDGFAASQFVAFECAVQAAAARPEPEVIDVAVKVLLDGDELPSRRAAVAGLLGDRGDASATEALRTVQPESQQLNTASDDPPTFAVETAVALAKLGDFHFGPYLVELLSDGYPPTQRLAAKGLQIAVAPGMVEALEDAVRETDNEVAQPAVQALFLLRSQVAVDSLCHLAQGSDPTVANDARIRINDILGTDFGDAAMQCRHWEQTRESWDPSICYRFGRPFSLRDLLDASETQSDRRREILEEIVLTAGVRPAHDGQFTPEQTAQMLDRLGGIGTLYRWGHVVSVGGIC